jgi:hypothetical protein
VVDAAAVDGGMDAVAERVGLGVREGALEIP